MRYTWSGIAALSVAIFASTGYAGNWPQFRGPDSSGLSTETALPAEWGMAKNIQWKIAIPGIAWSSPIIWGDRIFITTAISDKQPRPAPGMPGGGGRGRFGGGDGGERPALPPRPEGGGNRPMPPGGFGRGAKTPDMVYRWEVHCYNRADGKLLWKKVAVEQKPTIATHRKNTYASETPVTDGQRVYAYFGMTGLHCYDFNGELVWKKNLGSHPMRFGWGTGSSPALDGDRLFVLCDNEEKSFLAALEAKTGKELWRVDRDEKSTWGTPFVWRTKDRTELVTGGSKRVRSYDPATGKQLWELGGMGMQVAASPVAGEGLLFIGSSGPFGAKPLYAIKPGSGGDLTLKQGETANAGIAWCDKQGGPSMSSPLVYDGYVYVVAQNGGMLSCYDAKTGKPAYTKQRLPQAGGFTSSPWAHAGKVFFLGEDGQTYVVKAGPEYKLLGTNKLDEMFMATPAIAGNALFLRGIDHLFCVRDAARGTGAKP